MLALGSHTHCDRVCATERQAGKDVQLLPLVRLLPDRILDLVLANGYGK